MTETEIIAFCASIKSFAAPNHEERNRIRALDQGDWDKVLLHLITEAEASGVSQKSVEDIRRETKARLVSGMAAE